MTNHGRFEQDPFAELAEMSARAEFLAARGIVSLSISTETAINAAAIGRKFPTMNPGLAGPIMIQGIPYDSPSIHQLAMQDELQIEKDGWNTDIKRSVRWLAAIAEGPIRGYQQMGNTVVGMMHGKSFNDARRAAGSSILGEALQQKALHPDRPINLGDGWLPESQLPWETDGFTDRFRDNLHEDPANMEAAFRTTVAEALEEYGAPVTQRSQQELFSTPIRRTTPDGRSYISNYSPINAMLNPIVGLRNPMDGTVILEPDDAVYQTISKWGQVVFDVIVDPLNVPLLVIPKMSQARRFLPAQMSPDDAFRAGTQAKRHWYNPGNNNEWLTKTDDGKALTQYLTGNTSISEVMRVLDLGDTQEVGEIYRAIAKSKTFEETERLLMPHLGTRIAQTPQAHLRASAGRPIQSMRTALGRSYRGPGDYVTRMDSPISKRWIRWGAKQTAGVLDGAAISDSLHVAYNYMKTFNVPVEQIDDVLEIIAKGGGVDFTMAKAGAAVHKRIGDMLISKHGWHADDVKNVFGKYDETNDAIKAYHDMNMGNPVRGPGTRMKDGPDKVTPTEVQRPLTHEELAPGGTMPTSELVVARKTAGKGDPKIRAGVKGLEERAMGGSSYVISHGRKDWLVEKAGSKWTNSIPDSSGNLLTYKTKKAAIAAIEETLPKEARVLGELGTSVAERGVVEPVQVAFHPASGQYRVTDGSKRILAAEASGLETIPVEITDVSRRIVGQAKESQALRTKNLGSRGLADDIQQVRTKGDQLYAVDPMLEAEFAGDIYILPDQRDLRRMTSRLRKIRRGVGLTDSSLSLDVAVQGMKLGKIPAHYQSAMGMVLDFGMARWREWQLIAIRWMFNVIPDELFRLSATGYASPAYKPGQWLMWTFAGKGDLALTGDRWSDILAASDMGAGYVQNLTEVAQRGHIGDVRRVPWVAVQEGSVNYYNYWSTKLIHLWSDDFTRKSITMTRAEAFAYYTTPGTGGIEKINEIVGGAREGTRLSKLKDPKILVDHIAEVDARVHQTAGGTWRAYDVDPKNPGKWIDSNENVWGGKVDGAPPGWDRKENWVVTQPGDPDLIEIIRTGHVPTVYTDSKGVSQVGTRSVLWSEDPGAKLLATERSARRQGAKQVDRLRDELKAAKAKWKKAEEQGIVSPAAPRWVRGQDPQLVKRLDGAYRQFTDSVFAVLGQAPTMKLARAPFFRQVYWQEMARGYVNATPALRKVIRARAKQAKIPEFDRMVNAELVKAGYTTPKRGKIPDRPAPLSMQNMRRKEWDALADDDLVTVFHVTTPENADEFLKSGVTASEKGTVKADFEVGQGPHGPGFEPYQAGEGLYVGSDPTGIQAYGKTVAGMPTEQVTLEITVTKKSLELGIEMKGTTLERSLLNELADKRLGAVVKGDIRASQIRQVDEVELMRRATYTPLVKERAKLRLERTELQSSFEKVDKGSDAYIDLTARIDDLTRQIKESAVPPEAVLSGNIDTQGLPVMPKGTGWDEIDDLNEWGKAVGLDKTKSLLYDLTESHNVVDMNRNVFVFAEAFWEIISRWSNMLFNPQTRSFYNWEKARQIGEFAQQEGWMSDNEFGQTVWNYPSIGLLAFGQQGQGRPGQRLGTEITTQQLISNPLSQLGSGDAGALRSLLGPGFGPITQILAPPIHSLLPDAFKQPFQWIITGEFPLADSMMEQAFNSLPSSFKNAATLIDAELGMTERRFHTNTSTALELLAVSGEYDPGDSDQVVAMEKDALSLGLTITIARLFDSLFGPESPRYVPELLTDTIRLGQHQYIDAAALGMAVTYSEELFRDRLAAFSYVSDVYGLDPLNLAGIDIPKSRVIKTRPVTFKAFTAMQNNPEFYERYQFTAFAFAPDDPEEDFFLPAWYAQLSDDTTVVLTTEQQIAAFSNTQAGLKFQEAQRIAEEQVEIQVAGNPRREKGIRQDWRDWLRGRRNDIEAEHIGWSRSVFTIDAHYVPGPATPEPGDLWEDFEKMVVRNADGVITGMQADVIAMNPATAEFVRGFMSAFDVASADSVARGNLPNSWLNSTAGWASSWQTKIAEDAQIYVNAVRDDGGDTVGIEWIIRRWLDPALKGTDMASPFITDSGMGDAPVYRADDRIISP